MSGREGEADSDLKPRAGGPLRKVVSRNHRVRRLRGPRLFPGLGLKCRRVVQLPEDGFGFGPDVEPVGQEKPGSNARREIELSAELVLERVRIMEDPTLYGDCTGVE